VPARRAGRCEGYRVVRRRGASAAAAAVPGPAAQGSGAGAARGTGPVPARLAWDRDARLSRGGRRRRADAGSVLEVLERLAGVPVPASALETLILPGRVPGYSPALLDVLT